MKLGWHPCKWLKKRVKAGFHGYPFATVAYYGPDNERVGKVDVGIIAAPDSEPVELRRWFAESHDLRSDAAICAEISAFLRGHEVRSVSMVDAIIGCPHEEGVDYLWAKHAPTARFGRAASVEAW